MPIEFAVGVYEDLLVSRRRPRRRSNGGYYAIDSMRLEKGYRAFGRELTPDYDPVEAGLLFTCKLEDRHPVPRPRGRRAGQGGRARGAGSSRSWSTSAEPMLWGGELVLRDGAASGQVMSAAWGETLGACVGLAYVWDPTGGVVDRDWVGQRRLRGRRQRLALARAGLAACRRSTRTGERIHRPDVETAGGPLPCTSAPVRPSAGRCPWPSGSSAARRASGTSRRSTVSRHPRSPEHHRHALHALLRTTVVAVHAVAGLVVQQPDHVGPVVGRHRVDDLLPVRLPPRPSPTSVIEFVPRRTKWSPSRQYDAITPACVEHAVGALAFFLAVEWSISQASMAVDW